MLAESGFEGAELVAFTGYDTSDETRGATFRARQAEKAG